MRLSGSRGVSQRRKVRIRRELRVFAWNLRTLDTPFARRSLALNAIEHGRAWHWRILPAGWADPAFVLRHGQLKTKRAFAWFFPSLVSRANPEMYLYEIGTRLGPVKLELARPYLLPKFAPVRSKHIPGLKITQLADLLDAKISALSARGFARDLLDLYLAHTQIHSDWRSLLLKASRNQQNDYNPIELENNLKLLEQEFRKGTQDIPCERPPAPSELMAFLEELRAVNATVARDLTQSEGNIADESGMQEEE